MLSIKAKLALLDKADESRLYNCGNGQKRQWEKPCVYRLNERDGPELLLQVLLERNWIPYDEHLHGKNGWNLWWANGQRPSNDSLLQWQFTNHIPHGGIVTRKDRLVRLVRCMQSTFGAIYDFLPKSFVLPNEYVRFVLEYSQGRGNPSRNVWICKPVDRSRGRGITVFRDLHKLSYSSAAIVQRYLCNSLLVSGYKFDLRLYVCILSFRPLTAYLYHDGLVRFATEPFDLDCLRNTFSHITNSSINKFSPAYDEGKGSVGLGCKWTTRQLRHYLAGINVPDWKLWQRVSHIILLTLLCEAPLVSPSRNAFELYGFDIIVDQKFTPWLLEVNRHPSLVLDCDVDVSIKKPLLHDLMDLLAVEENASKLSSSFRAGERAAEGHPARCAARKPKLARPLSTKSVSMDKDASNSGTSRKHFKRTPRPVSSTVVDEIPTASPSHWSEPPRNVGGFRKLFPCSNKCWRSSTHTRSIIQYVRQVERLFPKVCSMAAKWSTGRIPDDEDYEKALQNLMGTEDVLVWVPRQ